MSVYKLIYQRLYSESDEDEEGDDSDREEPEGRARHCSRLSGPQASGGYIYIEREGGGGRERQRESERTREREERERGERERERGCPQASEREGNGWKGLANAVRERARVCVGERE